MSDAPAVVGTANSAVPPDWSAIGWDVHCPLCRYNLRGLNLPRCPECGYRFEWKEILDPDRREHPYLFEHHAERNWWSFRKTLLGSLRPKRFWTSLHPVQPSRPKRMLLYYIVGVCLFGCAGLLLLLAPGVQRITVIYAERARIRKLLEDPASQSHRSRVIARYGSIEACLTAEMPVPPVLETLATSLIDPMRLGGIRTDQLASALRLSLAVALIWPWATLAALMVFRFSMRRARVNTAHVVRCLVYTFDPLPFTIAGLLVALVLSAWPLLMPISRAGPFIRGEGTILTVLLLIGCGGLLFCCYRLWWAYQLYLRFDRAFWTVLASQVIVLLLFLNVLLALTMGWTWIPWSW